MGEDDSPLKGSGGSGRGGTRLVDEINASVSSLRPLLTRRNSDPAKAGSASGSGAETFPKGIASWVSYDGYFGRMDIVDVIHPELDMGELTGSLASVLAKMEGSLREEIQKERVEFFLVVVLDGQTSADLAGQRRVKRHIESKIRSQISKIVVVIHRSDGGFEGSEQLPFIFDLSVDLPTVKDDKCPSNAVRDLIKNLSDSGEAWPSILKDDPPSIFADRSRPVSRQSAPAETRRFTYVSLSKIENFRSIVSIESDAEVPNLDAPFVIIHGDNGKGKTSLMELLYHARYKQIPFRRRSSAIRSGCRLATARVAYRTATNGSGELFQSVEPDDIGLSDDDLSKQVLMNFVRTGILFDQAIISRLIDDLDVYIEIRSQLSEEIVGGDFYRQNKVGMQALDSTFRSIKEKKHELEGRKIVEEIIASDISSNFEKGRGAIYRRLRHEYKGFPVDLFPKVTTDVETFLKQVQSAPRWAELKKAKDSFFSQTLDEIRISHDQLKKLSRSRRIADATDPVLADMQSFIGRLTEAEHATSQILKAISSPPEQDGAKLQARLAELDHEIERCGVWSVALGQMREAYILEFNNNMRQAMATMEALMPAATCIYRAIDPGAARKRIQFGPGSSGNALFSLVEDKSDAGGETQFSTWHQLSAAQRINIGLSLFLARTLDESVTGSFLMDESFLHLDAYQRTNLLEVMRAILVRRNRKINFIITTADEFLLTHAVTKMRLLRRYFDPWIDEDPRGEYAQNEEEALKKSLADLDDGEKRQMADLLVEQAKSIREWASSHDNKSDDLRRLLEMWAKARNRLATLAEPAETSKPPVVVHRLDTEGDKLKVTTFYPR